MLNVILKPDIALAYARAFAPECTTPTVREGDMLNVIVTTKSDIALAYARAFAT